VLGHIKGTYRNYERTANHGYGNPVECDQTHSETADRTKEAVYDDIIWSDPAHPIEHAESCPQIPWDPIPHEAAQTCDIKEALS
jgi:hypothetical protein